MRRRILIFALLTLVAALVSAPAALAKSAVSASNSSSVDLVEHPKQWDGKTITFRGEVITEAQERGANAWIHINDDAYYLKNVEEGAALEGYNSGMPVWLPTELTKQIAHYGDYRHEGDVVTVRGVFHAACAQHGGDMDIHATALEVDVPGHDVVDPIHPWKPIAALVLAALAALFWVVHRRFEHRDAFGPGGAK